MQADRFTIKSQEALQAAIAIAADRHHTETQPEHLLLALLEQPESVVGPVLRKLGAQTDAIRRDLNAALDASPPSPPAPTSRRRAASCSTSCAPPSARPASSTTSTSRPSTSCSR